MPSDPNEAKRADISLQSKVEKLEGMVSLLGKTLSTYQRIVIDNEPNAELKELAESVAFDWEGLTGKRQVREAGKG
jgi:hypothetical protein